MRKLYFLVSFIFFIAFPSLTFAETENTGSIENVGALHLEAEVPDGFESSILLNFLDVNGSNIMLRLDHINDYRLESEGLLEGTYRIGFINIVGGNAIDYDLEYPENVSVEKGGVANFSLKISPKKNAGRDNNANKIEKITEEMTEDQFESLMMKMDESYQEPVGENTESALAKLEDPVNSVLEESNVVSFNESSFYTIIFFGVCGLVILLVFLFKNLAYKHDYYDIG